MSEEGKPASMELSCSRHPGAKAVHIDAAITCGGSRKRIAGMAVVWEPDSPYPCVNFREPLGIAAARMVLDYVETRPWERKDD